MSYLSSKLKERKIPELLLDASGKPITTASTFELHRNELKKLLQEEEYGFLPERPDIMTVEAETTNSSFLAGKAIYTIYKFTVTVGEKTYAFPVRAVVPKGEGKHPAFIHINFRPDVPDLYQPTEEILDDGFAIFSFCYKELTSDDGDFTNGVASLFTDGKRGDCAPGKIAMWAWGAMRVMDFIETLDAIDAENVAVIGHSRLGKTALFAGALDERFKYVISNNSGCSGAAITRGKCGEDPETIARVFPFWFCPRYVNNSKKFSDYSTYDQHFLLALSAPRYLLVGSAEEDLWADPESEFLSAYAASDAYKLYGLSGLITPDEIPKAKATLPLGEICYHVRHGAHFLSREDWRVYMEFIKSKMA